MATRDVVVNFITKLNDSGIKNATKKTQGLGDITKKMSGLAKAGYAAAATAATYYAQKALRSSINAALEDEKSQKLLAQALKMTASATNGTIASAENQIAVMSRATGTADDALRPALARLARSTKETSSAFDLLGIAQGISSATGADLSTVSNALGKAYEGNTAALGKLGLGIDKTLLKSGNLTEIMSGLRNQFAGFSDVEAKTMSGQLKIISVAAGEASETIGFALIDSMKRLVSDSGSLEGVTKSFDKIALAVSDVVGGLTSLTIGLIHVGKTAAKYLGANSTFQKIWNATPLKKMIDLTVMLVGHVKAIGEAERINASIEVSNTTMRISARNAEMVADKARQAAIDKFLKTQKALAEAANKAKKAKEDAAKLEALNAAKAKLAGQFDLDAIQLAAALKRKINDDDKTAVKALQALATDDLTAIQQATLDLDALRQKTADAEMDRRKTAAEKAKAYAAEQLASIEQIKVALNSLTGLDFTNLGLLAAKSGATLLDALAAAKAQADKKTSTSTAIQDALDAITETSSMAKPKKTSVAPVIVINQPQTDFGVSGAQMAPFERSMAGYGNGSAFGGMAATTPQFTLADLNIPGTQATTVNVTVQGSVLSDIDLAQKITDIVNTQNRLGNPVVLPVGGR